MSQGLEIWVSITLNTQSPFKRVSDVDIRVSADNPVLPIGAACQAAVENLVKQYHEKQAAQQAAATDQSTEAAQA